MYPFASQLGRLRPIILLVAAGIVGACADDRSITSPNADGATQRPVATANATPESIDPTGVTVAIAPAKTGTIRAKTGIVELQVNITCSKDGVPIRVAAWLEQYDRRAGTGVTGYGEVDVSCTTASVPSFIQVTMAPVNPVPRPGKADVLFKVLTPGVIAADVQRSVRLVEEVES